MTMEGQTQNDPLTYTELVIFESSSSGLVNMRSGQIAGN